MSFYYEIPQSPLSSIINSITLSNAIFDEIIVSEDIDFDVGENVDYFPNEWEISTKLHATFNNNIIAGGINCDFDLCKLQNSSFKIQRRLINDIIWTTVGYVDVSNVILEDGWLLTSFTDRTATPNETYQYMVTSIQYGDDVLSMIVDNEVKCWTDGISISDADTTYYTVLEPNISNISQNEATTIVKPMFNQFAYVFKNGKSNYVSGNACGLFAPLTGQCDYIFNNQNNNNVVWKYRAKFRNWLCNGKPKILKYYDGRIFLISVTGVVNDDDSEHNFKNITTWSWVEIGDINSTDDLISNGIINEGNK